MKTSLQMLSCASRAAVVCAALLAAPVFAQGHSHGHGQGQGGMDMKSMMKENNEKMASMQSTGKPDVDFAMMMREHHLGAIQMSEHELKHGKDAKMKDMARKIIAAQKKEIAQFDAFLAKAGHSMAKK